MMSDLSDYFCTLLHTICQTHDIRDNGLILQLNIWHGVLFCVVSTENIGAIKTKPYKCF